MSDSLGIAADSKVVALANRRASLLCSMASSDVDEALQAFEQLQRVETSLASEVCFLLSQAGLLK